MDTRTPGGFLAVSPQVFTFSQVYNPVQQPSPTNFCLFSAVEFTQANSKRIAFSEQGNDSTTEIHKI